MHYRILRLGFAVAVAVSLLTVQAGQALATAPTSAPTILGPADGSSVGNANPTLSWAAVPSAFRYRVQIATSLAFTSPIYSVDVYALQATPPSLLPFSTLYWRVAGEDNNGAVGPYSVASFTKNVSAAPVTVTPTNGQTLTFPTSPVVFSWQPVPGAVTYTLQLGNSADLVGASQVTGIYNTSYTLTDTQSFTLSDGVTPQSWWWQVEAVYANSSVTQWSTPWSYQINWPAIPQLRSPADGAAGVVDTIFSWDPVPGAASYQIQISPNGDWQNGIVVDRSGIVGTRFAPDSALLNSAYYWRVRARAVGSTSNYGQWSDVSDFTRAWSTRPVTVSPHWAGGLADPPEVGNLRFSWTPASPSGPGWVDHASQYEIQIGNDVYFSNGTYWSCRTDQTTFTPYSGCLPSPSIGTVYYWRVRGIDTGSAEVTGLWDSTSAANTQRFIYIPALPVLSAPLGGAHVQAPVLSWSAVSGAEQYRVTIKRDDGTQVDQAYTSALSYTTSQVLDPAHNPYTWNVETVDSQSHVGYGRASYDWGSFNLDPPATDTTFALLTPADSSYSVRWPSMTWKPYTGADHYLVRYGPTSSILVVSPLSPSLHYAGFTYTARDIPTQRWYWEVEAYDAANHLVAISPMASFFLGEPDANDWIIPWSDYLTPECQARTGARTCTTTAPPLGQTQELSWTPDPNAGAYVVYVAKDVNFTTSYRLSLIHI